MSFLEPITFRVDLSLLNHVILFKSNLLTLRCYKPQTLDQKPSKALSPKP